MPIAHLHCAKFGFIAYKNQVWEFGDKFPLILIPDYLYIYPYRGKEL